MVDNQSGNDLLDTTDCLEAVGVFKGWKNLLFLVVLLCLLLLQVSFFLVDRGYIKADDQAYGGEPIVEAPTPQPGEEPSEIAPEEKPDLDSSPEQDQPAKDEPVEGAAVEPEERMEPPDPVQAIVAVEFVEPNEAAEPDEAAEPNDAAELEELAEEPNKATEPNELADPNERAASSEAAIKAPLLRMQYAGKLVPGEFFSKMTFEQLTWLIRFVNAVLILTATLYCLTLLFSLKVSMNGRLGGISHISRAFFLSLLMLVLLLPWQKVFGNVVTGAIYTPEELVKWYLAKTDDMLEKVLYYLRFSGYGVLMLLLLILSQVRSLRWAKAILRRLEII
ncbi:MAG: hypothetical protein ACYSWO_21515 [Planctomycetota bacterium]